MLWHASFGSVRPLQIDFMFLGQMKFALGHEWYAKKEKRKHEIIKFPNYPKRNFAFSSSFTVWPVRLLSVSVLPLR